MELYFEKLRERLTHKVLSLLKVHIAIVMHRYCTALRSAPWQCVLSLISSLIRMILTYPLVILTRYHRIRIRSLSLSVGSFVRGARVENLYGAMSSISSTYPLCTSSRSTVPVLYISKGPRYLLYRSSICWNRVCYFKDLIASLLNENCVFKPQTIF